MQILPEGTVTFLFTDIEGSTRLWEEQPEAMRVALARHDALLRACIEQNDGYVFKTIGDAFCAAFATAMDALNAALTAQLALNAEPWPEPIRIKVRMALHTGAAEIRDNDYFGQPLNRVARLLAVGYGGQVLVSLVTQELVRDSLPPVCSLQNLGDHRLRDLHRPETIYALQHPDLPADFPKPRSLDNPQFPNNLPVHLTSFIGRERETQDGENLLRKTRLLTLTGTGGCGKTRLALQIAADVLEAYADGVWLVELAALADATLLPQTVAQTLGVQEQTGLTLQQTLIETLKAKHLLLVLDNCEHLLVACAQLAAGLLRACPNVKIMATSREGLGIAGEQTYRVPSLSFPDPGKSVSLSLLNQYEAVRLFIERARFHNAAFAVTNQNAPALAQLCHRLDGIPLAIELGAARIRSLSVEDINARLDNRFRLLTSGDRSALPRQQTLRALIDWSYDLLNAQEQLLLNGLSVFAGGWTLEAAEQVVAGENAEGESIEDWEVLDLLTGLVDKSLVIAEEHAGQIRYRMLETIRQYAGECLQTSGASEAIRSRHCDYFMTLAETAEAQMRGPELQIWLERMDTEYDNVRAALAWCAEEEGGVQAGLRLAGALWLFWEMRGHYSEGRFCVTRALERDTAAERTTVRAKALTAAGLFANRQGDYAQSQRLYEDALAIQREAGNPKGLAIGLNALANLLSDLGDYAKARPMYEETLEMMRQLQDLSGQSVTLNNLAVMVAEQGDYAHARRLYEEALTILRKLENRQGIAQSLGNLANVLSDLGDYAQARILQEEALAIKRELGDRRGVTFSLNNLGVTLTQQGDFLKAKATQEEALEMQREMGDKRGISDSLYNLGRLAHLQGEAEQARSLHRESLALRQEMGDKLGLSDSLGAFAEILRTAGRLPPTVCLWGACDALRKSIGFPLSPVEQEEYEKHLEQTRLHVSKEVFTTAWEEGRAMDWEQAVAYALETVDPS